MVVCAAGMSSALSDPQANNRVKSLNRGRHVECDDNRVHRFLPRDCYIAAVFVFNFNFDRLTLHGLGCDK